jgi:hypothetical protein
MRKKVQTGDCGAGGITGYPLDRIYEEVAFIAYHFHWGLDEVMNLPHDERRKWCDEISEINRKLSEEMER